MTSAAWNESYGDAVAVRRRGHATATVTLGLARDVCGVAGVDLIGDGRTPLADLVPVEEDDTSARLDLVGLAFGYLMALALVESSYPAVAELQRAHASIDNAPLTAIVDHVQALARVYSRWQGDVYAD